MPKKYSNDFKSSAAKRYLNSENVTYKQIAAELGIRPRRLRRWVLDYEQGLLQAPHSGFENRFHEAQIHNLIQAATIEHMTITVPADAGELSLPRRVGMLPPLAAARQDRSADIALASALNAGGTAIICQVLSGMGGVGKTQIAAAYASDQWQRDDLDLLLWVNAATRSNVTAAFAQAADEILRSSEGSNEEKASRLLSWLAHPGERQWLIVLDDLTDPADLVGLWPPQAANGRTIVTTRCRDAALDGMGRQRVDVGLFTKAEATQYLTERLGHHTPQLEGVSALAASLGYLPLALAQAAAYILDQPGLNCERYRQLFENRANRLAELSPDTLPDGYQWTVAATWSLSIERANQRSPAGIAPSLLQLASILDPNGIPLALFTSDTALQHLAHQNSIERAKQSPVLDALTVKRTFAVLHRLSLLDFDGTQVRVHALVQRAVYDGLDQPSLTLLPRIAADAIAEIWPDPDYSAAESTILRSNLDYLQRNAAEALFSPRCHPILFHTGYSLGSHGQVTMAAAHFQHLYETGAFILGPDHPDTLEACYNQAIWHAAAGNIERAIEAFKTVLDGRCRLLGPDHPNTRAPRNSLWFLQRELELHETTSGLRHTYIDTRGLALRRKMLGLRYVRDALGCKVTGVRRK